MCGRFALNVTETALRSHFHLTSGLVIQPRFNITPSTPIPIVKQVNNGVDFAEWGFVPSWYRTKPQKPGYINARMETLSEKPAFKSDFQKRRCLIPVTGYYEWKQFGEKKQPYYVHLSDEPIFAFAGIWSTWDTCAIITIKAPEFLQKLHDRIPAIVAPRYYEKWLSHGSRTQLTECLFPMSPDNTDVYAVTPRMGNPRFDDPICIHPI